MCDDPGFSHMLSDLTGRSPAGKLGIIKADALWNLPELDREREGGRSEESQARAGPEFHNPEVNALPALATPKPAGALRTRGTF